MRGGRRGCFGEGGGEKGRETESIRGGKKYGGGGGGSKIPQAMPENIS